MTRSIIHLLSADMGMEIIPGFHEPPESDRVSAFPGHHGGSLRVVVNDQVVTKCVDEDVNTIFDPKYDATGTEHDYPVHEFAGGYLVSSLESLCNAFEPFVTDEVERHREDAAEMVGEPGVLMLTFSQLDAEHIRVATIPRLLDQERKPPICSQTGFPSTVSVVASALVDCIEACLAYTWRAFIEADRDYDYTAEYGELEEYWVDRLTLLRSIADC